MKPTYIKTPILFTLFFLLFTCSGSTTDAGNPDTSGFGARINLDSVVLDGEIFVIDGNDLKEDGEASVSYNDVWKSSDKGKTWALVTANPNFPARNGHATVVLDNEIFVIGGQLTGITYTSNNNYGFTNDAWKSSDKGKIWSLVTADMGFSGASRVIALGGDLFHIRSEKRTYHSTGVVERSMTVWKSSDKAINWSKEVTTSNVSSDIQAYLTLGNEIIVIAESHVLRSSDGVNWSETPIKGNFKFNLGTFVVLDDKVFSTGGREITTNNRMVFNTVGMSSDQGETWSEVNVAAKFPARAAHSSVALDGEILVIGGGTYLGNTIKPLNDVWKSSDGGATWSEVK